VKIRRSRSITRAKGQAGGLSRPLPLASRQSSLIFSTPWGWMGVAESKRGLAAIVLPQRSKAAAAAALGVDDASTRRSPSSAGLRKAKKQLAEYLAGRRTAFALPLDLSRGTPFQRRVWKALLEIPYGQLWSYRGLAARVGGVHYARAVGGAVGANPLPIILPCHRVVAQDETIGGFSCGLPAKRRLLTLEGSLSRVRPGRDR
jgi:methylated-DNA-[protein]-cysteine S-methyltransferase